VFSAFFIYAVWCFQINRVKNTRGEGDGERKITQDRREWKKRGRREIERDRKCTVDIR